MTIKPGELCVRATSVGARRASAAAASLALGSVLLTASPAQSRPGFAVDRFQPSERGSDWLALDSLDFRQRSGVAVGVVGDFAHRPLIAYDEDGNELSAVVENQLYAHVGVSFVWSRRLRFAVNFPILLINDGERLTADGVTLEPDSGPGLGDLRLAIDARLLGDYASPFSLALGTAVHLPTGRREAFSSDGYTRVSSQLRAAGEWQLFAYAAQTGIMVRPDRSLLGQPVGTEWTFAAAAGVRVLKRRLLIGPELWGSTVVTDSADGAFDKEGTPLELVLGGHYALPSWSFGLGVGPGLARGLGTPALRLIAVLEWAPKPAPAPSAPRDRDRDTTWNVNHACPNDPGLSSHSGCPLPSASAPLADCSPKPGETGAHAKPGCPDAPDLDRDGIVDSLDACRDVPGAASQDALKHGCPLASDADGDGVPDAEDACPTSPGHPHAQRERNGCPLVEVAGDRIRIFERIEFEVGSSRLKPESDAVLEAVSKVLNERQDVKSVKVVGYTDDRGSRAANLLLSKRRAKAVVAWLVVHGIDAARLASDGLGPDQPLVGNDSEQDRQTNRRVEFQVVDVSGMGAASAPHGAK